MNAPLDMDKLRASIAARQPAPETPASATCANESGGVNIQDAWRFIGSLTSHDEGDEQRTLQTFDDSAAKRMQLARVVHGGGHACELEKLNNQGAGIFFTVNTTDGKGRTVQNIKRVRAVFFDADGKGFDALTAAKATGLEPHVVVESSPDHVHGYWLVDREFPLESFTAVQAAIARKLGTDPKVKDLPRVMRLPGFFHMKNPAQPFMVRIVEVNEHAPYSLEQIVEGLGLELSASAAPKVSSAPPPRAADVIDPVRERARTECEIVLAEAGSVSEPGRNDALVKFIFQLRERAAATLELCLEYGERFATEKCDPPLEDSEAKRTIRSAIRSARNPAGSRSEVPEVQKMAAAVDFEPVPAEGNAESKPLKHTFETASAFADKEPPDWIIKGVLPRAPLVVLYGESGAGKSFVVLDMAGAIARGIDWRGRKTKKVRVGYVAAEGAGGMRNRVAAYQRRANTQLDGLLIAASVPNLLDRADAKALAAAVKEFGPIEVLIVDTLAQATAGGDENSAKDMGLALAHCRALHHATGATVILIHHAGKDLDRGARGWSGLKAAADAELEVRRIGEQRVLRVSKLKDGADGQEFGFKLVPIAVGLDEDGDAIESCVVEYVDVATRVKADRRAKLPPHQAAAWESIHGLMLVGDEEVSVTAVIDDAAPRLSHDEGKARDRRRDRVREGIDGLAAKGMVAVNDGRIKVPA